MLDTFLNILAVIGIVAVGAFIIVFLSDLLISIIDNSNGIFFKRNKNSNGYTEGGKTYTRPVLLNTNKEEQREALTYQENKREFTPEKPVEQAPVQPQGPQGVDLNKAKEEEKFAHNYTDGRENMVAQRQAPAPAPAPAPPPQAPPFGRRPHPHPEDQWPYPAKTAPANTVLKAAPLPAPPGRRSADGGAFQDRGAMHLRSVLWSLRPALAP